MESTKKYLTQKYLKSAIKYDTRTGIFKWKLRDDMPNNWNGRFAGKIAGEDTAWGYRAITINYETHMAHNLAWLYMTGEWPNNSLDHKDLNGKNNKWKNLREATRSQNQCNRRIQSNNTSGYKGVHYDSLRDKWVARIYMEREYYFLGRYNTKIKAYAAYRSAAEKLHGEFVRAA